MNGNPGQKIITALDVPDRDSALSLVRTLPSAEVFKVGLRLFTAEGPPFLNSLKDLGKKVFLDLKLHDIPNTVADAVKVCTAYGVRMMTLHASGGREMMKRAAESAASTAAEMGISKPHLLAVTILTSLKGEHIQEIGMPPDTESQVLKLANLAKDSGMDGIVCSPQEIEIVRRSVGTDFLIVSPGIRPQWAAANDQKRIMTPSLALEKGADYIVIGRPIIAADIPHQAFERIVQEMTD